MIRRILLALTGSPYTPAAAKAAVDLSERCGSRLTAVSFLGAYRVYQSAFPIDTMRSVKQIADAALAESERRIEDAIALLHAARSDIARNVTVQTSNKEPSEALIEEWPYHDLTVIGLRGLFGNQLFPNPEHTLHQLISAGVRPILATSRHYRPIRKVIVAVSGSMTAAKVLKRYLHMQLWPKAPLHLVHVGPETEAIRQHLRRTLEYCQDHGASLDGTSIIPGDPRQELLPFTEKLDGDLLVLGDSGRSLLRRTLFGDTALHVVTNATRPLFLSH